MSNKDFYKSSEFDRHLVCPACGARFSHLASNPSCVLFADAAEAGFEFYKLPDTTKIEFKFIP
jgi:hypothetical protein